MSALPLDKLLDELKLKSTEFCSALESKCGGLPYRLTPAYCYKRLTEHSLYGHYETLSRPALRKLKTVQRRYGSAVMPYYFKAVLCMLMQATVRNQISAMPDEVRHATLLHYDRVINDFATQPDDYYALNQPRKPLEKDLAICGGWAIPIGGAWLVEKRRLELPPVNYPERPLGQSRKLKPARLTRIPLRHLRELVGEALMRLDLSSGTVKTCFVVHTVDRHIRFFNAQQHREAYICLAKLVALQEDVDGVYRSSWFLDPAVAAISPKLQFLSSVPLEGGAHFWAVGQPWPQAFRDALDKSPARKQAHADGQYAPWIYSFFWSRKDIVRWGAESDK